MAPSVIAPYLQHHLLKIGTTTSDLDADRPQHPELQGACYKERFNYLSEIFPSDVQAIPFSWESSKYSTVHCIMFPSQVTLWFARFAFRLTLASHS